MGGLSVFDSLLFTSYKKTTILVNINYVGCDIDSLFMFWTQVANLKKESEFHWFREDTEIIPDVKPDLGAGVCKLPIKLVITQY